MRLRLDSTLSNNAGWAADGEASRVLVGRHGSALLVSRGIVQREWTDPLAALAWLDAQPGRWVGFLAYELGRLFEPRAQTAAHPPDEDALLFAWGELDRLAQPASGNRAGPTGAPIPQPLSDACGLNAGATRSSFTRKAYLEAVSRCIDYIAAGDIFQVNLSQRLTLPFHLPAQTLYEVLRQRTPAAYGALLEMNDLAIVSNSPELFLQVAPQPDGTRRVITRPIKGTRPRAPGLDEALLASPKDAAELNMIIDLERNDLGRVCEIGSVHVTQPRTIEVHPTVFHGVATVEGQLRPEVGLVDLLRATFPGGSITGAPKIRAMQIIDELEPVPRGVYCGAIGHLDGDGSLQLNVAIRTMTLDKRDNLLHIPVGGGIVADSDPAEEYEETLVKARAGLEAVQHLTAVRQAHYVRTP